MSTSRLTQGAYLPRASLLHPHLLNQSLDQEETILNDLPTQLISKAKAVNISIQLQPKSERIVDTAIESYGLNPI